MAVQTRPAQDERLKEQAVRQLEGLEEKIKDLVDRHQRWEKDGEVFEPIRENEPRRWERSVTDMTALLSGVDIAYQRAVNEGGWPADDADLVKVREAYEAARSQCEKCGVWFPRRIEEKPIPEESNLCEARRSAFQGMVAAKAGDANYSKELFGKAEGNLAELAKENEQLMDEGKKDNITQNLAKHPYFLATQKEIERLKAECAEAYQTAGNEKDQAVKDWKAMLAVYKGQTDLFDLLNDDHIQPKQYVEVVRQLASIEKRLPELKKAVDDFCKKYGATADDIKKKYVAIFDLDYAKMQDEVGMDIFDVMQRLQENVNGVGERRKYIAKRIVENARGDLDIIDKTTDEYSRPDEYAAIKGKLQSAAKLDPENSDARELSKKVDEESAKFAAQIEKTIDQRKWPGDVADFEGPGEAAALAASSLEYLKKSVEWLSKQTDIKGTPIAVCIRGNWYTRERSIFGQTLQWGVDGLAAFVTPEGKAKNTADCFEITMMTKEELGVEKGPPFGGVVVGRKVQMRLPQIPLPEAEK